MPTNSSGVQVSPDSTPATSPTDTGTGKLVHDNLPCEWQTILDKHGYSHHPSVCAVRAVRAVRDVRSTASAGSTEQERHVRCVQTLLGHAKNSGSTIVDWSTFDGKVDGLYAEVRGLEWDRSKVKVASYIPQLAWADPERFAVCLVTCSGQQFRRGDVLHRFSAQSCSKTMTYAMACEHLGPDRVHQHVGQEPSGKKFNELTLNDDKKPHHPLINSGTIACAALLLHRRAHSMSACFEEVMRTWRRCTADHQVGYDNTIYLSERSTADRNFCLAYLMKEHHVFPSDVTIHDALDFYFQLCSVNINCENLSLFAATLANYGICPVSGERVFSEKTTRNCLSLMHSYGMYDYSGRFAFEIGLPAKSGVSGCIMMVVPGVMGVATYSPPLDAIGNSARGVEFCRRLAECFGLHPYTPDNMKSLRQSDVDVMTILFACARGHTSYLETIVSRDNANVCDYDMRTPLHIAAANGHLDIVQYLLSLGASASARDRFGRTALQDARDSGFDRIEQLLTRLSLHGDGGTSEADC